MLMYSLSKTGCFVRAWTENFNCTTKVKVHHLIFLPFEISWFHLTLTDFLSIIIMYSCIFKCILTLFQYTFGSQMVSFYHKLLQFEHYGRLLCCKIYHNGCNWNTFSLHAHFHNDSLQHIKNYIDFYCDQQLFCLF